VANPSPRRRARSLAVLLQFVLAVGLVAVLISVRGGAGASAEQFFRPAADAAVRSALPDMNFGTSTRLRIDGDPVSISYLHFDVQGLAGAVESAHLRVYPLTPYDSDFDIYTTAASWDANTVTYATRPAISDTVVATSGRVSPGSWMDVDVTSLVAGDGTVDVALTNAHETGISLASSEYTGFEPTLVVQTADSAAVPVDPKPLPPPDSSGDPMIAAAGDIACDPSSSSFNDLLGTSSNCHMMATSDVLLRDTPDAVLTLGDNQYEEGALADFGTSYDASWGRLKSITHPVPGNHEYGTSNASGYFDYFGAAAGDPSTGYYSFDIGSWHLVALNSQCSTAGCSTGSAQHDWLVSDLALHQTACTLAYWHIPRFSSGEHGSNSDYQPFWQALYDAGADVVLNGHDHDYERFAPQTPTGAGDSARGIREFVVGTGGKSEYSLGSARANSEVKNSGVFGVLELTLHPDSYDWTFAPEAGETFTDSGTDSCH
jgi:acid phosphatase type 7